jgi:hypothetical protein
MAKMILPECNVTRKDWFSCKWKEAGLMERYWDWHGFLLKLDWDKIQNENGEQVFQDEDAVLDYMHKTKMARRMVRVEEKTPLNVSFHDMLRVWFERNFAMGVVALPIG